MGGENFCESSLFRSVAVGTSWYCRTQKRKDRSIPFEARQLYTVVSGTPRSGCAFPYDSGTATARYGKAREFPKRIGGAVVNNGRGVQ